MKWDNVATNIAPIKSGARMIRLVPARSGRLKVQSSRYSTISLSSKITNETATPTIAALTTKERLSARYRRILVITENC